MVRVTEIKFDWSEPLEEGVWIQKISKKLKIHPKNIKAYQIQKESIDARKGVQRSFTVDVETTMDQVLVQKGFKIAPDPYAPLYEAIQFEKNEFTGSKRPIIIGLGPAGMFAALTLAKAGMNPLVFEMGEPVEQRQKTVDAFWKGSPLNAKSNVQFGEGGAGTFSDGKLTTRVKDERIQYVIETFIDAGGPEEIRYRNKPHIGTDYLRTVVKNIREEIIKCGGEIHFSTEVKRLHLSKGFLKGVELIDGSLIDSENVVVALGHSSRDLFENLYEQGVAMESKPFAMGIRIEHPQEMIDFNQYGDARVAEKLGAAEYKLSYTTQSGRSVYSFCMCPGGEVVASQSEENTIVVNGMSEYARSLYNSNSALLVNVSPEDFEGNHPLAGIALQRQIEQRAFNNEMPYAAPQCTLEGLYKKDGLDKQSYSQSLNDLFGKMEGSYRPSVYKSDFVGILPDFILEAIKEAIPVFGRKIKGFDHPKAIVTGVETRSSSPVRLLRHSETFESINLSGLYPCGEGAGYAGGITSSAIDGIKVAEAIMLKYSK